MYESLHKGGEQVSLQGGLGLFVGCRSSRLVTYTKQPPLMGSEGG